MLVIKRLAAYILDILLLFVLLAPLGFLLQWATGSSLPQTGPEIWRTLLWNFSIPAWLYFGLSDGSQTGATLGKRLLKLKVVNNQNQRLSTGQAVLRTAVKLVPWELVHISAFALSEEMSVFSPMQTIGLAAANMLTLVYVVVAVFTSGQRSIHDFVAQSRVLNR
ncbi:MAG: RDD family protein [Candidatus Promineifilaceae bacterium]